MKIERVVFFAASEIAVPCLEKLLVLPQAKLVGVVTQPSRARGRGQKMSLNPIANWAQEHAIPFFQAEKMDEEAYLWIKNLGADLALVMAFGHLLKPRFLELFSGRFWNFHTSLLPKYRGASPIQTCILNGEKETGVSLMRIVEKMDAGPYLAQANLFLDDSETTQTLTQKLAQLSAQLLADNFVQLSLNEPNVHEQDDQLATFTRKFTKEDGLLDFSEPAIVLERKVRAFNPWPGTYFVRNDENIKVHAAHVTQDFSKQIGAIQISNHGIVIQTSREALAVDRLQRPGGKVLNVDDFLRGAKDF